MIVDCAVYQSGERQPDPLSLEDALESLDGPDALVWIELVAPTPSELDRVAAELQIHPLVIEDALKPHQRPKLESYPSSALLVLKTVERAVTVDERRPARRGTTAFGELQVIIGPQFVITVRHGQTDPVADARLAFHRELGFPREGVAAVLYALTDAVVDRYEQACDDIEEVIDGIEDRVFMPGANNAAELIFEQKRSTLTFLRNVAPLVDVMTRLATSQPRSVFEVPPTVTPYFRDVLDHLLRVQSRLEQSRDLLAAALEANLAQITVRQNEDMRAISGWAAIIAVPTLFAGVWGMNFAHMPELEPVWGYPLALLTIAASSYITYRRLKRNGWL